MYQYKDHLGNVRLSYTDNDKDGVIDAATEIIEESNYYPFGLKHKGYNTNYNPVGNATAQKKGFANEELEEELGKNTIAYQWRDYDPAIGRFNKPDRFAEKYVDASPYHYTSNNPIAFREIAGDSILVHFYDKKDKVLKEVPDAVQDMFMDEFGISVGYNSKTNMLYFDGKVSTGLSQSSDATNIMIDALEDTNTGDNADKHGVIEFGYNLRSKSGDVVGGAWTNGTTQIDLADFDSDGNSSMFEYSPKLNKRAFNMARTFEHEYLGHQRLNIGGFGDGGDYTMGRVVETANTYARQRGIPERLHYGGHVVFFGSTSQYGSKREQKRAVKKMVNGKIANDKFIKRKRRN